MLALHTLAFSKIEQCVELMGKGRESFASRNDKGFKGHQRDFNAEIDRYGPQPVLRVLEQLGNY